MMESEKAIGLRAMAQVRSGPYEGMISFVGPAIAGAGANGGARARLIVAGSECPQWFIDCLPSLAGSVIEIEITGRGGRKMAFCRPTAGSLAALKAQIGQIAAAQAAASAARVDCAVAACLEAQALFAAARGWIVIETANNGHWTEAATLAMSEDNLTHEVLGGCDARDWARFQSLEGSPAKAAERVCNERNSWQKSRF